MIWIYFALIFQCLHLIPGRAMLVKSLAFLCSHLTHQTQSLWCFIGSVLHSSFNQRTFLETWLLEIDHVFCTTDVEISETRIEFHSGTDLDLACRLVTQFCFLFSLSFLCYALNFMTASGQLECCLSSNSPSALSGHRLCWTHAGIFQVTGPKSLWGMTEIYHLVDLILNLMCVFIVF